MEDTVAMRKKGSEAVFNPETQNCVRSTATASISVSKRKIVLNLYKMDTEVRLIFLILPDIYVHSKDRSFYS